MFTDCMLRTLQVSWLYVTLIAIVFIIIIIIIIKMKWIMFTRSVFIAISKTDYHQWRRVIEQLVKRI